MANKTEPKQPLTVADIRRIVREVREAGGWLWWTKVYHTADGARVEVFEMGRPCGDQD